MSVPVITVPWLPGSWCGFACIWFVIIRKGKEHYLGHEMVHIDQQRRFGGFTYLWRYFTNNDFRARMEVEAFLITPGFDRERIAYVLKNHYGIDDPSVYLKCNLSQDL